MHLRTRKPLYVSVAVLAVLGIVTAQDEPISSAAPTKHASCPTRQASAPAPNSISSQTSAVAFSQTSQKDAATTQSASSIAPSSQPPAKAAPEATPGPKETKPSAQQESEPSSPISKKSPSLQPSCTSDYGLPELNSQASETSSDSEQSLAAVAARTKAAKNAHAKKIITDDNLDATVGPLPHLKMNRAENGEEVIAAIGQYKQSHTAEQTEEVVHRWYDEYDKELADAINSNLNIQNTRAANLRNDYDLCQSYQDYEDYRKCQVRGMTEMRGSRDDQVEMRHNSEWIVRLQHSLMNIRGRLFMMGLNYPWFKVRTTNGIDRF